MTHAPPLHPLLSTLKPDNSPKHGQPLLLVGVAVLCPFSPARLLVYRSQNEET